MQIVIDIPEEVYDALNKKSWNSCFVNDELAILEQALYNGTPLPKGHGRLFILDEEIAKKYFVNFSFSLQDWISEVGISEATLKIIKADKDGE